MTRELPVAGRKTSPRFSDLPFWKRLFVATKSQVVGLFCKRFLVINRSGLTWLVDQKNMVDQHLLTRGGWEATQFETLLELIQNRRPANHPAVFLDIGSHGGLYAIQMARTSIFKQIVSIEADRRNANQQRSNLFLNDLDKQVELIEAAAYCQSGEVTLQAGPERNRGATAIGADGGDKVKAITIDSLGISSGVFVAAKIDVEGAELDVIAGMRGLLKANPGVLQVETRGENADLVRRELETFAYRWECCVDDDHYFCRVSAPKH